MGWAGRKGQQSTFVLLTLKWTQVKGSEEVEDILSKRTTSSVNTLTSNAIDKSLSKPTFLAQKVAVNISNDELVQGFTNKDTEFDDLVTNELFDLLFTDSERNSQTQKSKKLASKSNIQKRQNLQSKIFDYIHTAKCCRFFLLI